jgi:hypothetical protein
VVEPALPEAEPELESPKAKVGHHDTLWIANGPIEQAAYAPGMTVTLKLDPASGRIFHVCWILGVPAIRRRFGN